MRYTLLLILVAAISSAISGIAYTQNSQAEAPQSYQPPKSVARFAARFKAADTDHDGALTLEEAHAAGLNHIVDNFDRLDANRDGKVTIDELRMALRSHLTS